MLQKLLFTDRGRLFILICYWICGFLLTHLPIQGNGDPLVPHVDKIGHFVLYSGLGFFVAIWIGTHLKLRQTMIWSFLACTFYGILDEGLQMLVPSRFASFYDWLADVLGAAFGIACYGIIKAQRNRKTSKDERGPKNGF